MGLFTLIIFWEAEWKSWVEMGVWIEDGPWKHWVITIAVAVVALDPVGLERGRMKGLLAVSFVIRLGASWKIEELLVAGVLR